MKSGANLYPIAEGMGADIDLLHVAQDGPEGKKGCVAKNVSPSCQDITRIYYQMDRLVAYATLPCNISFRLKDEGMASLLFN